jgi:hypothetical protein
MKYLIIIIVFGIVATSCEKYDPGKPLYILPIDIENGELIESGFITYKQNLPDSSGLMGWGPPKFRIDTITYRQGQFIYDRTLLGEKDCRSDIQFHSNNYHPMFYYNYLCKSFGIDTIHFELKKKVNAQIRLKSNDSIRCVEVRSLTTTPKYADTRYVNGLIDIFDFDGEHILFFTDTTFQLQLIKNDTIKIQVRYLIKGRYNTHTYNEIITTGDADDISVFIGI